MSKFKYFLLIVISLNFLSFKKIDYIKYTEAITENFTREISKKYGLVYVGGGGKMNGDLQVISLSYQLIKKTNIENARIFYINLVQDLLKKINEDKLLRIYLRNYPFNFENIDISISFINENDQWENSNNVCCLKLIRNNLFFFTSNVCQELKLMHREEISESLKKVKETKSLSNINF